MTDASPPPAFGFFKIIVRDLPAMLDFYDRTVGLSQIRTIESDVYTEVMCATPGMEKGPFIILYFHKDGREISVGNGWGPVGFWVTCARHVFCAPVSVRRRSTVAVPTLR